MRGGGVEDLEENKPGKVMKRGRKPQGRELGGLTWGQQEASRPEGRNPESQKKQQKGGIKMYEERK